MTRHRVYLDFSEEGVARLEEMKKRSGKKSNAVVIRDALRLLEWYIERRDEGWKLLISKDNVAKEVELLFD